jgi:hypothetical protein
MTIHSMQNHTRLVRGPGRMCLPGLITVLLAGGLVAGCRAEVRPPPTSTPQVTYAPDPANPSNLLVTVTFKNPVETSERFMDKPVLIKFDTAALVDKTRAQAPVELEMVQNTNRTESTCRFSLPASRVTDFTVDLGGCDNKPVGESVVRCEIRLGRPPEEGPVPGEGIHAFLEKVRAKDLEGMWVEGSKAFVVGRHVPEHARQFKGFPVTETEGGVRYTFYRLGRSRDATSIWLLVNKATDRVVVFSPEVGELLDGVSVQAD